MKKYLLRALAILLLLAVFLPLNNHLTKLNNITEKRVQFTFERNMLDKRMKENKREQLKQLRMGKYHSGLKIEKVYLVGPFSKWIKHYKKYPLIKTGSKTWQGKFPFKPGKHRYSFLVIGRCTKHQENHKIRRWIEDLDAPILTRKGRGRYRSFIITKTSRQLSFTFNKNLIIRVNKNIKQWTERFLIKKRKVIIDKVYITGRFINWAQEHKDFRLKKIGKNKWTIKLNLGIGKHYYKFLVRYREQKRGGIRVMTFWVPDYKAEGLVEGSFGGQTSTRTIESYKQEQVILKLVFLSLIIGISLFSFLEIILRLLMRSRFSLKNKLLLMFIFLLLISNCAFVFYTYRQKVDFTKKIQVDKLNLLHSMLMADGIDFLALDMKKNIAFLNKSLQRFFRYTYMRQDYVSHSNRNQQIIGVFVLDIKGKLQAYNVEMSRKTADNFFLPGAKTRHFKYYNQKTRLLFKHYLAHRKNNRSMFYFFWHDYILKKFPWDGNMPGSDMKSLQSSISFFRYDTFIYPIYSDLKLQGYYLIRFVPKSYASLFKRILFFNLLLVLIAGALYFLLISQVGKIILKPLNDLIMGIDFIKKGDLNYVLDIKTGDEIERLGHSYNFMREKLLSSKNQIEQYTNELESLVDKRTMELKDANLKLQQADKLKSQFFANVSHELRTPLTLILAPLESLIEEYSGEIPNKAVSHLTTMHNNSVRLLRLINSLLELSRIEAGKSQLLYSKVNIHALLHFYLSNLNSFAETKSIGLDLDEANNDLKLYLDLDKAEQIFMNLLSNALKFTPEGGRISISIYDEGENVRIDIKDTGIGMAREELDRIFERFMQLDVKQRKKQQGTGIGLYLVKNLIELHNGSIKVDSHEGQGTVFSVTFKKGKAHISENDTIKNEKEVYSLESHYASTAYTKTVETISNTGDGAESNNDKTAEKILIVEDDPELRVLLSSFLQPIFNIITANDGLEGLEKAGAEDPDLIITDVMMPHMTGYELCEEISKSESLRHIPVILLTAQVGVENKIEGLQTGAVDYIYKPFKKSEILSKVETIFRIRQFRKALMEKNNLSTLGTLTGGLMHEIKNPANYILGNVPPVLRDVDRLHTIIEEAHLTSDKSSKLVNNIKETISYVESGAEKINQLVEGFGIFLHNGSAPTEKVDLAQLIESILIIFQSQIQDKIQCDVDVTEVPVINVNRNQVTQVFTNLIQNAIDAMPDGGSLLIKAEQASEMVKIEVSDTGQGIDPDIQDKLFNPFFTTKDVGEGMGLGLYLAYSIIQSQGGKLYFHSTQGDGSTFIVEVPV